MTISIQKTGLVPSEDEALDDLEREMVNSACNRVLSRWELENRPVDVVELIRVLNGCAAVAQKTVRDVRASAALAKKDGPV